MWVWMGLRQWTLFCRRTPSRRTHALANGATPDDLDACNSHEVEGMSYHYHAGEAGGNAILFCLKAQAGCASEDPDAVCDPSVNARPRRP
jgi:hypothetical protein